MKVTPIGSSWLAALALSACSASTAPRAPASSAPGDGSGLPAQCPGQCDAKSPGYPAPSADGSLGDVTMYTTEASDGGACNYEKTSVRYFAAMSVNVLPGDGQGQWQHGRLCGQCAEVTALTSQGPKSVVLRIMDKCPDGYCGIDLGGDAPAAIMLDGYGRYYGKWRFVSCAGHPEVFDGVRRLHVMHGSNAWWSRVQVRDPVWPVQSIAWQSADGKSGGSFPYASDPENTFEVPVGEVLQSGMPSLEVTVQFIDGSAAMVSLTPAQLGAENGDYPLP